MIRILRVYFLIISFLLFGVEQFCFAQADSLLRIRKIELGQKEVGIKETFQTGEMKGLSWSLFKFYKIVLSEQFAVKCMFQPSCSEFALRIIKRRGVFLGFLLALDRLSRCNGHGSEQISHIHYHPENSTYEDSENFY